MDIILSRRVPTVLFLSALLYAQTRPEKINQDLFAAIRENSADKVVALLKQGADPNTRDAQGLTPLQVIFEIKSRHRGFEIRHAPMYQNLPLLTALLDRGARVNVRAKDGTTPLHTAVNFEYAGSVKLLLEHGADVNARDNFGVTPLNVFAQVGSERTIGMETLQLLLDHRADVNARDAIGRTALMYAASRPYGREIIKQLLDKGAKVDIRDRFRGTALMYAARGGDPEHIKILLAHGAAVNVKDKQGKTALAYVREGQSKAPEQEADYKTIISLLKQAGAKE